MKLLLSGEGPTDFGSCTMPSEWCEQPVFIPGPLAHMVDQLLAKHLQYSLLDTPESVCFVPKQALTRPGSETRGRRLQMPGRDKPKDTGYFRENARLLGEKAKAMSQACKIDVIAILFRDADGTNTSSRSLWQEKWHSMLHGFNDSKHPCGVPMVANPKLEAWLLCAMKKPPYQHCEQLEELPGNDDSPNSPKKQLSSAIAPHSTDRAQLVEWVQTGRIDVHRIRMPSFQASHDRLLEILSSC